MNGEQLGLLGMDAALANAEQTVDRAWRQHAESVARALAGAGRRFTADDIVARCGTPQQPNVIGALFGALRREGAIRSVGYQRGSRASQHGRPVAVWVGAS